MPRVTIWLDDRYTKALSQEAVAKRRRPADQAAAIIERALARRVTQSQDHQEVQVQ